jgi:hypothetical protein
MMAGGFLTLITIAHVVRAVMGWSMVVNVWTVPVWASVVAAVITGLLALCLFRSACCCCCKKEGSCDDKAGDKKACCDKPADAKPA